MNGDIRLLRGGTLVLPDRSLVGGTIVVRDGRIEAVLETGETVRPEPGERVETVGPAGATIMPGLFEFHIHGAGGIGFESVRGAADLRAIRDFLFARGVATFVPTMLYEPGSLERLVGAIVDSGIPRSTLPCIHLEGPFVNPARRGGIPAAMIRAPDRNLLERIIREAAGYLGIMTLAPELPGAESLYLPLREAGVLVSLGHSDCRLGEIELPPPPFSVTHLFNAMSGVSHREAGLANLPFCDPRPFVELNADGVHVNTQTMALCAAGIRGDRLILTSDAVASAGLPPGSYDYFGKRIVSGPRGVRYESDDVLMGSSSLAPDILGTWMRATGMPIHQAVASLTAVPARALGLEDRRGGIVPGADAVFAVLPGGGGSVTGLAP